MKRSKKGCLYYLQDFLKIFDVIGYTILVIVLILYIITSKHISTTNKYEILMVILSFISLIFLGIQIWRGIKHDEISESHDRNEEALKAIRVFNKCIANDIIYILNYVNNYINEYEDYKQSPYNKLNKEQRIKEQKNCLIGLIIKNIISLKYLTQITLSISKWSMNYIVDNNDFINKNLIDSRLKYLLVSFARLNTIVVNYIRKSDSDIANKYVLQGYNYIMKRYGLYKH